MNVKYHLQKILLVVVTTVMVTSAMTCEKLVDESDSIGNTGFVEIMDTGRYMVNTTGNTRSQQVQSLIEMLDGASDIQYKEKSFTAKLLPKDLKKVYSCAKLSFFSVWATSILHLLYQI